MVIAEKTEDVRASILTARWKAASAKFMALAEAIPDSKFEVELVKGTRSCGEVLRHVAYWNRYVADSLHGSPADGSGNELPREEYGNKASILQELRTTNSEIAEGIGTGLDAKVIETLCMGFEHLSEHYGQLAVYARLVGIVPPASRA